jgi:hypothetical protein
MSNPAPGEVFSEGPDINLFVLNEGRLPRIGDAVAPCRYRGWLLCYTQMADAHSQLPGR